MLKTTNVDFSVSSDIYNLYITDMSCWGVSQDFPAVIEILVPGFLNPYKQYFNKQDTSYNSIALELNCGTDCDEVELPDGIYNVLIKASPSTFFKELNYLKSDQLQMKLDLAYVDALREDCGGCVKKGILEGRFLILASESHVRRGDIKTAAYLFKEAQKIVDRINKCKNCR